MTLRSVIVMAVLAVLCGLAWYALKDGDADTARLPATWPEFVKGDVTKVVLTSQGQTLTLRRRVDRTDSWEVDVGSVVARADASAVTELLTQIARQEVRYKIGRGEASAADVGIGELAASAELTVPAGPVTVRYGRKSAQGGSTYVDSGPGTDVWVVGGDVAAQIFQSVEGGMKAKHLTDFRQSHDVGKVEIVRGGVTGLEAEVDPSGIWRFRQPFSGPADPGKFADFLSKLVNTQVATWAEVGAADLEKYGLATPQAEVVLHPRRQGASATIQVGSATPDGQGVFALEKGYPNVAVVPKRFLDAVLWEPLALRDRSFTRIGIGEKALKFTAGEVSYKLGKQGNSWDVVEPKPSLPGDDTAIRDALKLVREWHTHEFLDSAKPEDHGIDGKTSVEILGEGDSTTTLLFGNEGPEGRRYAQRKDADGAGGVELVDGAPFDLLAKGYAQFKRKVVRDLGTTFISDIERIAREPGRGEDGSAVQPVVVERKIDSPDPKWTFSGPGQTGAIETAALNGVLDKVTKLVTTEWFPWDPTKNEAMGFVDAQLAATLSISVRYSTAKGTPPGGAEQTLLVGKKRPEGGYFARMPMDEKDFWAFVLSEEDFAVLSRPFTSEGK